ncbi:LOW QUALITY PROTEIN: uncharacterized protein LOC128253826 [Drosophila gunungcola]|uniref:LOW QUALITY PROTEIN: uncharacterized protein LOC128253826 n=1 Tax=Drosophila gunungcola TaxID=103775 RepID=UPI0022E47354|nr:LOW QUALITY PROTEIN: uncharacterized protein LOC128253826 [Drosophila gunungcola]
MPRRKWVRSKYSVHLPRGEFVEIVPQMGGTGAGESESSAGSGPRMTVNTLSAISQLPSSTEYEAHEEPKEDCSGCRSKDETVKSTRFQKDAPNTSLIMLRSGICAHCRSAKIKTRRIMIIALSSVPKMLEIHLIKVMPSTSRGHNSWIQNNPNMLPPTVPKWDNHSSGCIIISSDDEELAGQKNVAFRKSHMLTTTKRSHSSMEEHPKEDPIFPKLDKNDTKVREKLRLTGSNIPPIEHSMHSDDFVFHQNLDNKIAVKTVMPKFLSKLQSSLVCQPSSSKDNSNENPMWVLLPPKCIAPMGGNDNAKSLMPELLPLPSTSKAAKKEPMEQDFPTCSKDVSKGKCGSSSKHNLANKNTVAGKKQVKRGRPKSVWHKGNLCECALREMQNPEPSKADVESWRSTEAICMRLRGIDVPDKIGLLEETPSFEDIFDVLGIKEEDPKAISPP